jgi:hypothetical protein
MSKSWSELRNRILAIKTLLPHLDEAIENQGQNPIEVQRTAIEELFSKLELKSQQKSWKLNLGDSLQTISFLTLSYNSKPQSSWPIFWTNYSVQYSDQKGKVLGPIAPYSFNKGSKITSSIRIEDALATDSTWLNLTPLLKGIKGPTRHVTLTTQKKEIALKFTRSDEGDPKEMFSLRGALKNELGKMGFEFPKKTEGLKWEMEIQANVRKYPMTYGLQPVEVDIIITLNNQETQTEVYSTHIPHAKGVGSTYETALSKAWKIAAKKINRKLKKAFKSEIQF